MNTNMSDAKDVGDPGNVVIGNAGTGNVVTGNAVTGNAVTGNAVIPDGKDVGGPGNAVVGTAVTGNAVTGNAVIPDGKDVSDPGKGWYSRGYLPHLDQPGLYQSINFRLCDSLPAHVIERWKEELHWRENMTNDDPAVAALRRRIVAYEDAGHGACWLRDERIAALVENALLYFDSQRYRLIAWCIMPNHVHVLIETWPGHPLYQVLHSWKSFTAQKANKLLGRQGGFWAREYYDRFMRDEKHLAQTIAYIEQNPVKAGLVASAELWRFGSAARRA